MLIENSLSSSLFQTPGSCQQGRSPGRDQAEYKKRFSCAGMFHVEEVVRAASRLGLAAREAPNSAIARSLHHVRSALSSGAKADVAALRRQACSLRFSAGL
jgi:hypothetical protein